LALDLSGMVQTDWLMCLVLIKRYSGTS
jgi:hypothetical protein